LINIALEIYNHLKQTFRNYEGATFYPIMGTFRTDVLEGLIINKLDAGIPAVFYTVSNVSFTPIDTFGTEFNGRATIDVYYAELAIKENDAFPELLPDVLIGAHEVNKLIADSRINLNMPRAFSLSQNRIQLATGQHTIVHTQFTIEGIDQDYDE
jgi:hypothetical protein